MQIFKRACVQFVYVVSKFSVTAAVAHACTMSRMEEIANFLAYIFWLIVSHFLKLTLKP